MTQKLKLNELTGIKEFDELGLAMQAFWDLASDNQQIL